MRSATGATQVVDVSLCRPGLCPPPPPPAMIDTRRLATISAGGADRMHRCMSIEVVIFSTSSSPVRHLAYDGDDDATEAGVPLVIGEFQTIISQVSGGYLASLNIMDDRSLLSASDEPQPCCIRASVCLSSLIFVGRW
ncbi:unnamed protein product [Soboliphyme baturini]|uniref:Uncharacterized protein n=1 Tax=Soboliphyme baturini TaxID=241478 RepID=A0A183IU89_9BILA|nr:unnamed protein product [Soboliphyme baturini]